MHGFIVTLFRQRTTSQHSHFKFVLLLKFNNYYELFFLFVQYSLSLSSPVSRISVSESNVVSHVVKAVCRWFYLRQKSGMKYIGLCPEPHEGDGKTGPSRRKVGNGKFTHIILCFSETVHMQSGTFWSSFLPC